MNAYYNENDPKAASWLRELIKGGHIADGEVDERSIADVGPDDTRGFRQCHFFAGIGGWSIALRLAGWPDDRPVWTGSCPCQPFSVAGRGKGNADERHLWPEFARLIRECRPAIAFGEQVTSRAGRDWLAAVRAEMEALGYGVGAADLCAAGVGAPHIRQRLYWVADADSQRRVENGEQYGDTTQPEQQTSRWHDASLRGSHGGLADTECIGFRAEEPRAPGGETAGMQGTDGQRQRVWLDAEPGSATVDGRLRGTVHGGWTAVDWLGCTNGKWRTVEPGTFPLAAGLPRGMVRGIDQSAPINAQASQEARVMRVRGYGNAIVPAVAAAFVRAAA